MRIAYVSTMAAVSWGGSEELWAQSAKFALDQGHQVMTLTYGNEAKPKKLLELIKKGSSAFYWNHLNRVQPLNLQDGCPEYFPYNSLLDWRPDLVVVSHGGLLDVVNGHYLLIDLLLRHSIPYVLVIQANTELYKPSDQQRPIMKAYFSQARKVFFVSKANLLLAERQIADRLPNAEVINNPVNLGDYEAVRFPELNENQPVSFASVGRLDIYSKGQDVLFQVLGSSKWKDRNWVLNLYGEGPDFQYLQELAKYYGISEKLKFCGQVESVRDIWKENQLLLLPSRIEGTPLVLFEAMLCGRSAVVTNIGGNAEWIKDEINGFVSSAPFPENFSEALDRAWSKRDSWKNFGDLARRAFLENHEIESGLTLLNKVLSLGIRPRIEKNEQIQNENPKVSVVVPCYNLAHYLRETIDSIMSQTYKNFEIIIVNPSSPDNILEVYNKIINDYGDTKIRMITIDNFGQPAYSRNYGIEQARGEYVLCLDADDFIAPRMLELGVGVLDQNKDFDIAYSNYCTFEGKSEFVRTGPFDLEILAKQNMLPTCSMYRRSAWQLVGGYKTNCAGYEDWDFWISLAEKGRLGFHLKEYLFFYRMRENSFFKDAESKHDKLLANIILNHPNLYTEDTKSQAVEYLNSIS